MRAGSTSYTYDAENRMTAVSGAAAATFVYDGDGRDLCTPSRFLHSGAFPGERSERGNRVKGVVGGVTTTYIGNYFEWSPSGKTTLRVQAGQREESSLGLYWYNSRWYSPGLGRFVSPDSIIPQPGIPMAWDRYSYTYNNPVRYTDPSGHFAWAVPLAGFLIGGIVDAGIQLASTGKIDIQQTAGAAVAGAVSASVMAIAAPVGIVSSFLIGGSANVIGNQAGALVEGALNTDSSESFFENYSQAGGIFDGENITNLGQCAVDFAVGGALNAVFDGIQHKLSKVLWMDDPFAKPPVNYNPIRFVGNHVIQDPTPIDSASFFL